MKILIQHRREFIRLCLLSGGYAIAGSHKSAASETGSTNNSQALYQESADKIRSLFVKKKAPGPHDWLATQEEAGQTFAQFIKAHPKRVTDTRTKLYLQPIGEFNAEEHAALQTLREYLGLIFGLELRVLMKISLEKIPESARRENPLTGVKQILSTYVLDKVLIPNRPIDAVAVLAITTSDLWPGEGWNFVFGQASLQHRVGVWSTARFGHPVKEQAKFLRRVLQVATHETGHMFGIEHCTAYECCMNGSNSLDESDRNSLVFCAECDPKLWWACKLDPAPRAKALAAFAKHHAMEPEAEQWTHIAELLVTK